MMVRFTQRDASLVRLGEIAMILELHRQGVSVSAIARQVGLDRKTVRKYIERGLEPPMYGPRPPRASIRSAIWPAMPDCSRPMRSMAITNFSCCQNASGEAARKGRGGKCSQHPPLI